MATRREKTKKAKRYADAKATAEKQQRGFEPTTLKIPKGTKHFQFKEEKIYRLLVVSYEVQHGNPNADDGMFTWERTYYAHDGLGPNGRDRYVCPAREAGNACPIHAEALRLRKSGADADLITSLEKTKKRQLIGVVDLDNKDDGVQIYEGPYSNGLGELIDNKIDASDDDSPYRNFFHDDAPMKLLVKVKKDTFNGNTFYKPVNVEMEPIKPELVAKFFEAVPCLDDCLSVLDADALKKVLEQTGTGGADEEEEDEDDDRPKKKTRRKDEDEEEEEDDDEDTEDEDEEVDEDEEEDRKDEEDDEEDEEEDESDEEEEEEEDEDDGQRRAKDFGLKKGMFVTYKKEECEIVHISPDGTSLTLENEDEEVYKAVDPIDVEPIKVKDESDDEDEEEKPKKAAKKPAAKKPAAKKPTGRSKR